MYMEIFPWIHVYVYGKVSESMWILRHLGVHISQGLEYCVIVKYVIVKWVLNALGFFCWIFFIVYHTFIIIDYY